MRMNAQEALEALKKGNAEYVADQSAVVIKAEDRLRRVKMQDPYAIVLSCADSRVTPEAIFNSGTSDLFVCRVAGNIANTSSIASIEYAVAHLGTKLIVVLGHQSCGAVGAALAGGDNGYNLNHLCAHIAPAIANCESSDVNAVVKQNAIENVKALTERSSIISEAVANNGVEIVPAYYDFETGEVTYL